MEGILLLILFRIAAGLGSLDFYFGLFYFGSWVQRLSKKSCLVAQWVTLKKAKKKYILSKAYAN